MGLYCDEVGQVECGSGVNRRHARNGEVGRGGGGDVGEGRTTGGRRTWL